MLQSPVTSAQFDAALRPLMWNAHGAVPLIIDLQQLETGPTTATIQEVVDRLSRFAGHGVGPVAVVAQRDNVFGAARMLTTYAKISGIRACAFRTGDAADQWIRELAPTC